MKIEELIKQNKEDFEERLPSFLWNKIQNQLTKKRQVIYPFWRYLAVAASLGLVLSFGIWIGKNQKSTDMAKELPLEVQSNTLLVNYVNSVEQQKEELRDLLKNQPSLKDPFINDITHLDEDYQYLRAQLENHPTDERVIEAMLKNLEIQTKVLNKQNEILKEEQ